MEGARWEDRSREFLRQAGKKGARRNGWHRPARVECPSCGRDFSEFGISSHRRVCRGPSATNPSRAHNNRCQVRQSDGSPCGRLKASWADRCFRCAGGFSEPGLEHLQNLTPGFDEVLPDEPSLTTKEEGNPE